MEELRQIKGGFVSEEKIFARVFELERLCGEAFELAPLPEEPDADAIEQFIFKTYSPPLA